MSEYSSFRVDPQKTPVENCQDNVRNNCDIFVMIIGGRRGSFDVVQGKSIVNMEYEAAVAQGLDIYVFIDSNVLALLHVWKENANAVLSPIVDSNDIFVFIEQIRKSQRWTYPFSTHVDVKDVLAKQLSNQLRELLEKRRSGHLDLSVLFQHESEEAKKIVFTRGKLWEYALAAELLECRLSKSRKHFRDIQAGRVLGPHRKLGGKAYMDWVSGKFPEAMGAVNKIVHLLTEELDSAYGPAGQPDEILRVAQEVGRTLEAFLDFEEDVFRTRGPKSADPVSEVLQGMTGEILETVEQLPPRLLAAVEKGLNHKPSDGPLQISIDMVFKYTRAEQFNAACQLGRVHSTGELRR